MDCPVSVVPHPMLVDMHPLKVVVFDDDYASLKWNSNLLMRDPRTTVVLEANSLCELFCFLDDKNGLDALLLDIDNPSTSNSIENLLSYVLTHNSKTAILCLSNNIDPVVVTTAITLGVHAYLLKAELGMGIATAVTLARNNWFVYTPSTLRVVRENGIVHEQPGIVISWEPHPQLTPSLQESFELRVIYRMRAPLAAIEIHKSTQTIEKYVKLSYLRLEQRSSSDFGLDVLDWDNLTPEDRAFILYTQPNTRVVPLAG